MKKYGVISLSGGMDSSTLLLRMLREGFNVTAISFDYGQKHRIELDKSISLIKYLKLNNQLISHHIIKLDGLQNLLNSTLVEGNGEVPEGHYKDENMKETVVPNRNKIFSSIIQAIALSITKKYKKECVIAMGIHAGDHEIYPDCRQTFRDADMKAFQLGNWNTKMVKLYTPYLNINKVDILKDGIISCKMLNINFNEIYKNTITSYKPFLSGNSDYKSASSVERILAFYELGKEDPIQYEDETGLVSWEIALKHALNMEKKWKK